MTSSNHFILARPFIESAVARCVDHTAYSNTDLHHACSRLVLFVGTQPNVELTDSTVFAAPTIEKYIATLVDMSPASRGNLRSMLYRMSEVLLGTTGKGDMSYALSASSPSEPYVAQDEAQLRRWCRAQSDTRSGDARVLLALGFGAGLSAGEIVAARPGDIEEGVDGSGRVAYFVNATGARARRVQLDGTWAVEAVEVSAARASAEWLFAPKRKGTGKNLISNFIARGPDTGLRPNTQRMRATYLVKHIEAGDSVTELMRVAGVQSLDALARYVRFVGGAME
jgi:hypothetical protein